MVFLCNNIITGVFKLEYGFKLAKNFCWYLIAICRQGGEFLKFFFVTVMLHYLPRETPRQEPSEAFVLSEHKYLLYVLFFYINQYFMLNHIIIR